MKKPSSSPLMGAAFLMATSAIGPGFLTQTARFTGELLASFGFVILISLLLDIGAQWNIWRIITVSGKQAEEIAQRVWPGLGWVLALLIGFGGLVFNIGNIAGTGLGFQAMTGLDSRLGALISAGMALFLFWQKDAGKVMDAFVKLLGILMILFTLYVTFRSQPPLTEALYRTIWPEQLDAMKIVTLVGGTVGGYISFAGAHRLLQSGVMGKAMMPQVDRSATTGIVITTVMRYILFLAVLGVVSKGFILDASDPAGSSFRQAAGNTGYRFFGLVMWCAAITSVVGASFTSVSFFTSFHPLIKKNQRIVVSIFILASLSVFLLSGSEPVLLLVLAGAVNGLILPIALAIMLIAVKRRSIMGEYQHPLWLYLAGWLVVAVMGWMGWITLTGKLAALFQH